MYEQTDLVELCTRHYSARDFFVERLNLSPFTLILLAFFGLNDLLILILIQPKTDL